MTRSWPVLTGHLLQHTDFRSPAVVHVPQVGAPVVSFNVQLQMTRPGASAVVRAGAFARDRCVDHLSHDLVCGVLAVHDLDV